jgi:hypothetical protein
MKKLYEVKKDFWVGEINKKLGKGQEVNYDLEKGQLFLGTETFVVKNLKAAIKAEWLVPINGDYSDLDEPVGETQVQAMDRKRKERFKEMAKNKKEVKGLVKDEREVKVVGGSIDEEKDMSGFNQQLGIDIPRSEKKKFSVELVEDDTRVVSQGKIFDNSEAESIKKALNQNVKTKADKGFQVFKDHYDADTVEVASLKELTEESTLDSWDSLHWSKKAELIQSSKDKKFLMKIKDSETSVKIKKRIDERLADL